MFFCLRNVNDITDTIFVCLSNGNNVTDTIFSHPIISISFLAPKAQKL